jgi:hypothetical protein
VAVPLALIGGTSTGGALGRCLRAWAFVLVAGVAIGYTSGTFPAERVVSFAFVIPIAAGIGLASVAARIGTRPAIRGRRGWTWLAAAVMAAGLAAMTIPSARQWLTTPPQLFPLEALRVRQAVAAIDVPPGTPLVAIVSGRQPIASFFATEAGNAIRASVPPDRIRDVRVLVPGGAERPSSVENDRLVAQTRLDAAVSGSAVVLDLAPFDRAGFGRARAPGVLPPSLPATEPAGEGIALSQPPSSAAEPPGAAAIGDPWPGAGSVADVALVTLAVMGALVTAGLGWARWCVGPGRPLETAALAPVIGAAVLTLAGIAADGAGVRLGDGGASWALWAGAAVSGAGLAWRSARTPSRGPAATPLPGPATAERVPSWTPSTSGRGGGPGR